MQASANNNGSPQAGRVSTAPSAKKVTPLRTGEYANPSLAVDKNIVNELLLVCGVIGSTVDPNTQQIVPVEDCINWLQDLQRALRRDEDAFRPISILLGQWKVVEQKLLPLVLSCRYNTSLILTIVKILVILTKPISENAKNAASMIIDTRRGKTESAVIKEQIKLRENAIAQENLLAEYKNLFVHHPSHLRKKNSKDGAKDEGGLLSVFVSLLAEPLSKTGLARTAEDHLTMELILHLFRNLLCAGEPTFKDAEKVQASAALHQELIALFEREMVLDFITVIGQEMENRENKQYNLLLMEILHHMFKNQDPTLVARSVMSKYNGAKMQSTSKSSSAVPTAKAAGGRSLMGKLKRERQQMQSMSSSRHSHFAGTLVQQRADGQQRFQTASSQNNSTSRSGLKQAQSSASEKRKTKKHQYFIGSASVHAIHTASGVDTVSTGPLSRRANQALHSFCVRFMSKCYGPVMKSLKNEFRRDSSRLESHDKVIFFRLIWFFSQWWRVAMKEGGMAKLHVSAGSDDGKDASTKSIGHLIFTMDVFTFNLVLSSSDFFLAHKKYKELSQSVALYAEMMHLLTTMYTSSDSTEQIMAMGLMDRLFYQSEPIDRVPKLLSAWIPGTFTRNYLCDLLELSHTTLKLLDANAKSCENYKESKRNKKSKKGSVEAKDAVERMRSQAADFDVPVYMARKIVSNQTVFLFTQLLSQYNINATHINDHVVSFFVRLCKFVVAADHDDEWETEKKEDVTLEPMLYNLPLLTVLNEILNDTTLQDNQDFNGLLKFSSTVVRHFARAAEKNPMLHVEVLFRHAMPHRFCESIANMYVTEELLMIAERDTLLEQSREDDESVQDAIVDPKAALKAEKSATTTDADAEEEELDFFDDVEAVKGAKEASDDDSSNDSEAAPSKDVSKQKYDHKDLSGIEKELDEDEDRWNDRRSFLPKRKLVDNQISSEEAGDDDTNIESTQKPEVKRIRRSAVLDDSDDEEFGKVASLTPTASSARMLLEDSDED